MPRFDPDRVGRVYFIEAVGSGAVKVGFCWKRHGIAARMDALQTGCPFPLRLAGHRHATYLEEVALHKQLAPWRIHREWFAITPELVAILALVEGVDAGFSESPNPIIDASRLERAVEDGRRLGMQEMAERMAEFASLSMDQREGVMRWGA